MMMMENFFGWLLLVWFAFMTVFLLVVNVGAQQTRKDQVMCALVWGIMLGACWWVIIDLIIKNHKQ